MIQSLLLIFTSNSGNANASSYAKDNLVSRYKIDGSSTRYIDYSYDGLNRLTKKSFVFDSTTKNTEYTYWASNRGSGYTTTQLDTEKLDNTTYKYYYDNVGNITSITKNSGAYRSYTYDNKNQLTKEVNSTSGITTSFTYDSLGNITKKVESGNSNKTINYSYGNNGKTGWNNLLTGVDLSGNGVYESNETISYDNIGNPTTYLGASLTWFGRQLKSYTINSQTVNYTYDADGLRSSKSALGVNCTYQYVGGQLRYETRGAHRFYYYYDANGNLSAIRYYDANGTASIYFVLTNAQGDVKSIYSNAGVLVASYEYDAFGNCTITQDTTGIGALNLIRYRGYYLDSETGLYYLQSRYYNPKVGRFLNADGYVTTGQGVTSYNMFAYCLSNPILFTDDSGARPIVSASLRDETEDDKDASFAYMKKLSLVKYPPKPVDETSNLTQKQLSDKNAIALTIYGEQHSRSIYDDWKQGQEAVAWVIINRYNSSSYPSDWTALVTAENQFTGYGLAKSKSPGDLDAIAWDNANIIAEHMVTNQFSEIPYPDGFTDMHTNMRTDYGQNYSDWGGVTRIAGNVFFYYQ